MIEVWYKVVVNIDFIWVYDVNLCEGGLELLKFVK